MTTRLISLGAWCRPAYQLSAYADSRTGFEASAYPFDWTITSFRALSHCLDPGFSPESMLQPGNTRVSFAGSGMCDTSGLIFHHAISPEALSTLGAYAPGDRLPEIEGIRQVREASLSRFLHTFRRLQTLQQDSARLVFVRWQRAGHPDRRFATAFEGETEEALLSVIERFLGHDRFRLLIVRSQIKNGHVNEISEPVRDFRTNGAAISCNILERRGWNGDLTNSFKGDEHSWRTALDQALAVWERYD